MYVSLLTAKHFVGISFFHKRTFVFNTKFALRLFSIRSFSINLYSAKDILNTMIDDVPCFEENQTLSASLAKSIPHTDHSQSCSVSAQPLPSPGPENSSTHKMRATREKSHSQMGGPTSRWLWKNLRVWDPKSAHPTWQNLPGRKTFFARVSPECHEEISLNVPSRRNCIPKGVTSSQICLLDSNTPPPKASPLLSCLPRKERPAHVKHGAALEHGVFCSFLSQGFPSPPSLLCSSLVSLTSFHDTRKAHLHTMLPVHLEPGCK